MEYNKEHKYNGFTYIEEKDKARIEHNKSKPEYLFKYYALNKYSVDALVNGYFYASHPFDLNDVTDSSQYLLFTSKPLDFSLYQYFFGKLPPFKKDRKALEVFYESDVRINNCRGFIDRYWQTATGMFGIISVTANSKSTLMWPHYTQEKGFQIKFKTSAIEANIKEKLGDEAFVGLFPVNYSKKLKQIDVSEYKNWYVPLYYATNIKTKKWKYEDEWRFIISGTEMGIPHSKKGFSPYDDKLGNNGSRNVFYNKNLIEEITFGMDYFLGQDFITKNGNNSKIVTIKDECLSKNFSLHKQLLAYIASDFTGKIYLSSISKLRDRSNSFYLMRNKRQIYLNQVAEKSFRLVYTENIIDY